MEMLFEHLYDFCYSKNLKIRNKILTKRKTAKTFENNVQKLDETLKTKLTPPHLTVNLTKHYTLNVISQIYNHLSSL